YAAKERAETAGAIAKQAPDDIADERERLAYARNLSLALVEHRTGDGGRAKMFLDLCPARLRGWDWRYVYRLCHADAVTLTGHIGAVWSAAFSPDGTRIVTAGNDNTAVVWDTASGRNVAELKGHRGLIKAAAFSP